ncbi:MAG: hypothetical protein ACOYMN_16755 [Roseimicrobium sp.]
MDSAPFYNRQLHQMVEDQFHIERPQITDMADHLEAERLTP